MSASPRSARRAGDRRGGGGRPADLV